MKKNYEGYHKTIRYREGLYQELLKVKKASGIPISKIVHMCIDSYLPVLKERHLNNARI